MQKLTAAIVSVLAALAMSVMAAATVDAAPRPSAKVCATWENGRPYVGAATLRNRDIFAPGRTLNTSPRGCMVWKNVQPGRAYRVIVSYTIGSCSDGTHSDGRPYRYGSQTKVIGSSVWKVAPRTGQVDLGHFTVNTVTTSC